MVIRLCRQLEMGVLVLLIGGACHKTVIDPVYPDDRGEKIANLSTTTASFNQLFGWSPDGTELFYLATTPESTYQILALNIQSRTIRLVAQDSRWKQVLSGNNQALLSPDGQFIYFSAQQIERTIGPPCVYLVDTRKQSQIALIDSSNDQGYRHNSSIMLSPDGSRLSFRYRYDSVRVHNLATKTSVRLLTSEAIAFSPDGSRVLVSQEKGKVYRNVSLTDFSATDVDIRPVIPPSGSSSPSLLGINVVWHPEGIQYVYGDFNRDSGSRGFALYLWNSTQQKRTLVWPDLEEEFPVQESTVVWSRNGQRIAYTTSNVSQSAGGRSPNLIIYTTDMTTLKTTKIATITLHDDEKNAALYRPVLIAPDNTKLAHTVGSIVYIAAIQP